MDWGVESVSKFSSVQFPGFAPGTATGRFEVELILNRLHFQFGQMRTHQEIDQRSLAMARCIVERIDHDPGQAGLEKARANCSRWFAIHPRPAIAEWLEILRKPWEEIRAILLDDSEEGRRLRQSDPFCGILTPRERWAIYREFSETR
jgi:hypothetical protein